MVADGSSLASSPDASSPTDAGDSPRSCSCNATTHRCAQHTAAQQAKLCVGTANCCAATPSSSAFGWLEAAAGAGSSFSAEEGSFHQEPGSGAVATVAGHRVSVGTLDWVMQQGAGLPPGGQQHLAMIQARLQAITTGSSGKSSSSSSSSSSSQPDVQLSAAAGLASTGTVAGGTSGSTTREPLTGHTQVFVGIDGRVMGLLDVADIIRPDARRTVRELQQQGIQTVMLSGDRQEAALKVAEAVGIPAADVHAGIKPAGKAALVQQLKSSGRRVAMVGDGINDTAALAAAHVGMAMAGGVDAASDVAKVVLMGDQLHQVG